MKLYSENDGKMTRDDFILAVDRLVIDARVKLEKLEADDSDTAYFLSIELSKAIHKFECAADSIEMLYEEIAY